MSDKPTRVKSKRRLVKKIDKVEDWVENKYGFTYLLSLEKSFDTVGYFIFNELQ